MNRSELVNALATRFPELGQGDVDASVKTIVESIGHSLATGKRVEIRGFGSFAVTVRPSRASRNPKTGEPVTVPRKATPRFKAGQMLRQRVNVQPGAGDHGGAGTAFRTAENDATL